MTPHPTTVKAAREIDDYEPFLRYMDYAANADCDAAQERVNAEVAAIIERECHVSEMVRLLAEAATLPIGVDWCERRDALLAKVSHER